ncbi:hypothetical protein PISMIDRAFT_8552 [Pisolithus microcarpus 441]|uniref:Uncharacterized protein n=1 Tax=Pisolithus microcarpus 441 TaxID=765257 RepID=A0A0C9YPR3_9AGAM|nr:hypothetical protein PISMIDRAFT_8552 [Pisolithus microcarpus 441]
MAPLDVAWATATTTLEVYLLLRRRPLVLARLPPRTSQATSDLGLNCQTDGCQNLFGIAFNRVVQSRWSAPHVRPTAKDLWFRLAMVDEEEEDGPRGLTEVLLSYGEHRFEATRKACGQSPLSVNIQRQRLRPFIWLSLLLTRAFAIPPRAETSDPSLRASCFLLAALSGVDGNDLNFIYFSVTLSPVHPPALGLSTLIRQYVRQWGNGVSNETLNSACELARRIISLADSEPAWENILESLDQTGRNPSAGAFCLSTISSLYRGVPDLTSSDFHRILMKSSFYVVIS